jgi:hypothetical protein
MVPFRGRSHVDYNSDKQPMVAPVLTPLVPLNDGGGCPMSSPLAAQLPRNALSTQTAERIMLEAGILPVYALESAPNSCSQHQSEEHHRISQHPHATNRSNAKLITSPRSMLIPSQNKPKNAISASNVEVECKCILTAASEANAWAREYK